MTDSNKLNDARILLAGYGDAAWLLTDARTVSGQAAGPVIYICDVSSGRVLLLQTNSGALQQLSEQADVSEAAYTQIREALNVLLGDLLRSTTGIHPDTRRGVILGAAFCITETRGFHITKHHDADVQYLLLRYVDVSRNLFVLTPMPVFKAHPITATDLNATATHVLLSEQLNFPERFANDKPLAFKETRRNVLAGISPSM